MIAIKDMEMPVSCAMCPICYMDCTKAICTKLGEQVVEGERLDNCPLIEIEQRKQGEWIINDIDGVHKCPFCKHEIIGIEEDLNFCCKCGVKLSYPKKKRGGKK